MEKEETETKEELLGIGECDFWDAKLKAQFFNGNVDKIFLEKITDWPGQVKPEKLKYGKIYNRLNQMTLIFCRD